ncbi:hypothetical protein GQX74_003426 [Glossina fuscipes]|nr:hypothetical protein GQX74_003426 [Glossina fuscipes]
MNSDQARQWPDHKSLMKALFAPYIAAKRVESPVCDAENIIIDLDHYAAILKNNHNNLQGRRNN